MIARAFVGSYLIAGPIEILGYVRAHVGLLLRGLGVTSLAALAGFLLGNAVAMGLAVVAVRLPRTERLISALALVILCLPMVATGPILRVL